VNLDASPAFTPRDLRDALGRFATGVAVVTACDRLGAPVGMTMSSFNAVSLDPPLVLFSVARTAHSLDAMQAARGFAVNILGRAQADLSQHFARAQTDKWQTVVHSPGYADAPVLADVLAHFECRPYAQHDGGDHVIFVCRVLHFATSAVEEDPLIFYRGRYHTLAADGERGNHAQDG
jgi:flavin reductase (DIM6/NTAB) family NADH-FMN oxidoreductase RutF